MITTKNKLLSKFECLLALNIAVILQQFIPYGMPSDFPLVSRCLFYSSIYLFLRFWTGRNIGGLTVVVVLWYLDGFAEGYKSMSPNFRLDSALYGLTNVVLLVGLVFIIRFSREKIAGYLNKISSAIRGMINIMIKWMVAQINYLGGRAEIEDLNSEVFLVYLMMGIFAIGALAVAFIAAWGQVHFWAAFVQEFIAVSLWGLLMFFMILGLAAAIYVWKKTENKVISWAVALLIIIVAVGSVMLIAQSIPGVGLDYH